jgi:predicted DsbA family dithiol-disulfide isomerase
VTAAALPAPPLPGTVQVWSDVACPWATLALTRLRSARRDLGLELDVRFEHRSFPLEVANGSPLPPMDEEAVEVLAREPSFGARRWSGEHGPWPGSVLPALAAVRVAGTTDDGRPDLSRLPAAEELDWALRRALLAQSRPVGTPDEVLAVAAEVDGVDVDQLAGRLEAGVDLVLADWELAKELDVQGSPQFRLTDGTSVFNPGVDQPYEWGDLLRRALAAEG